MSVGHDATATQKQQTDRWPVALSDALHTLPNAMVHIFLVAYLLQATYPQGTKKKALNRETNKWYNTNKFLIVNHCMIKSLNLGCVIKFLNLDWYSVPISYYTAVVFEDTGFWLFTAF